MPIIVKARPGESVDRLIVRFKRETQGEQAEFKERQYFVSETEKRLEAEKKKRAKIRKLEALERNGLDEKR